MERAQDGTIILSADEARAGVTGHNVRYVLGFGLFGIVAAFAAIPIYFGWDQIVQSVSHALARDPIEVIRETTPYILVFLLGSMMAVFLLGVWTWAAGSTSNATQAGMRARVVLQLALICMIMAVLLISTSSTGGPAG